LKLGTVTRIHFANKYGVHFFSDLVLPSGYERGKRYPLVITTYRSDYFLRGGVGDEYPIQSFAANGLAVLSFDCGVDRNFKSGDFSNAILHWDSPESGLKAAIAELDQMGIIDPSRVGITGLSRGAEIVHYGISHSDLFRAAIASDDSDARSPFFFYLAGRVWRNAFAEWGLAGWPEGSSSPRWHRLSASLNVDKIHTPLLVNASDSEYVGGLDEFNSLEVLHKPVEMFVYTNELHIKNQPKHRYEIYERNVDWMRFWLQDYESPEPSKREQYERWHHLRELRDADEPRH